MTFFRRGIKVGGLALLLALLFLATTLSGSGQAETLRFVFMADSRGNPINTPVLTEINTKILALSPRPAFVIFGGDLALTGVNRNGSNNFQAFKNTMKPLTDAGIKLYVTVGNHELYKEGSNGFFFLENQRQYQQAFANLPANGPPGYEHLTYSFESPGGDAFFAILDPYYMASDTAQRPSNKNVGVIDQAQLAWLRGQIAQTKASHKFLCTHVPLYQVNDLPVHDSYFELWSLLDKAGFDLFCCGHVHLYSRKAIDRLAGPRWHNSVVQLICGTAGAPPVKAADVSRDFNDWHIDVGSYYYSVVDINGSQVAVDSYGGKDGNYKVIDSFNLTSGSAAK